MKLMNDKISSGDQSHHFKVEVQYFRDLLCRHHQGIMYWVKHCSDIHVLDIWLLRRTTCVPQAPYHIHVEFTILWHVDPLLGNDCKISSYTTAIAK
jgi:hypothetical protein